MDYALNLNFRGSEIDQQTNSQSGGFEVIQTLSHVYFIELSHRLDFDEQGFVYQNICDIFSDDLAFIPYAKRMLLCDLKAEFAKLQNQ